MNLKLYINFFFLYITLFSGNFSVFSFFYVVYFFLRSKMINQNLFCCRLHKKKKKNSMIVLIYKLIWFVCMHSCQDAYARCAYTFLSAVFLLVPSVTAFTPRFLLNYWTKNDNQLKSVAFCRKTKNDKHSKEWLASSYF